MADTTPLTLVIPCYNEADRLDRAAFAQALTGMGWLNLCFVDDGSTDDTAAVLRALCEAYPARVQLLTLPRNGGKAEAVRQGLQRAATQTPVVGFWDADLAAPLSEIGPLRDVLSEQTTAEWIFGIRLQSLGRMVRRAPLRHYLGRAFATVVALVAGIHSYDTQCGAKLFRVTPLLRAVLDAPFRSRWIFDVEMLLRAEALLQGPAMGGRRPDGEPGPLATLVYEQPLGQWTHQPGSKVRATDFLRALRDLWIVKGDQPTWAARGPLQPAPAPATTPSAAG